MSDPSSIDRVLSTLKTCADLVKAASERHNADDVGVLLDELRPQIFAAQSEAAATRSTQRALLKNIGALQATLAWLHSGLKPPLRRTKIPSALVCTQCGAEMRVVAKTSDPDFGFAGVELHDVECTGETCENRRTLRFKPHRGYR